MGRVYGGFLVAWAVMAGLCLAAERHVPGEYATIQAAIDDCNDADVVVLAEGTYSGPGNVEVDFLGKAITLRSSNPADVNVRQATIVDAGGGPAFVIESAEDANCVFSGITIVGQGPTYNGPIRCSGVRMVIDRCRLIDTRLLVENPTGLTVRDCLFQGAVLNTSLVSGPVTVSDCTFENAASGFSTLVLVHSTTVLLDRCRFTNNRVALTVYHSRLHMNDCQFVGNGPVACIVAEDSDIEAERCEFVRNRATSLVYTIIEFYYPGAAISAGRTALRLTECLFSGNRAVEPGGAIYASLSSGPLLIDRCTFVGNRSACGGSAIAVWQSCEIENSILRDDGDEIYLYDGADVEITHSDVSNGWPGAGNIDVDPCFVDAGYWDANGTSTDPNAAWINGDYHLKSQGGRWSTDEGLWVIDDVTSPCIDAGDPAASLGAEPFPNGGRVNMGVYAGTEQASKSYFGQPRCQVVMAGDINGDCSVDMKDFAIMAARWSTAMSFKAYDPTPADGETDVIILYVSWSPGHGALSHDVYFGHTRESVEDADPNSPSFVGNLQETRYIWHDLSYVEQQDCYWRVDEVYPTTKIKGDVWHFVTDSFDPRLR